MHGKRIPSERDLDRFWDKVNKQGPEWGGSACWMWTACLNRKDGRGYGLFGAFGTQFLAHRFAYEALVGPIPEGMTIDHLCRNRRCVNPAHLEPVTNEENLRRSPLVNAQKTHCKSGHELTPDNIRPNGRGRQCIRCARERYARQREELGRGPAYKERTHCPQGHPYDERNTLYRSNGDRACSACNAARAAAWREKNPKPGVPLLTLACGNPECGKQFKQDKPGQRQCSPYCTKRRSKLRSLAKEREQRRAAKLSAG
jgi:hypothetical protein